MAQRLTAPPGLSDNKNFRAREAFDQAIEAHGKLVGSTTVDVGSIAAGAIGTVTIPVPGARADRGMTVVVGVPSAFNTGLVPWGYVSADDVVTVVLFNGTVGAINPPSAVYHAWVRP
jgi:hypothetical protein